MYKPLRDIEFARVKFDIEGEVYQFILAHNLPETPGLSLADSLLDWASKTKEFTAENFCKYVASKKSPYICLTEKQFQRRRKIELLATLLYIIPYFCFAQLFIMSTKVEDTGLRIIGMTLSAFAYVTLFIYTLNIIRKRYRHSSKPQTK